MKRLIVCIHCKRVICVSEINDDIEEHNHLFFIYHKSSQGYQGNHHYERKHNGCVSWFKEQTIYYPIIDKQWKQKK